MILQIYQSSVCPQLLKDWHLALGVLTLVLADLTILLVYTTVEGAQGHLEATRVPRGGNPSDKLGVGLCMPTFFLSLSLCPLYFLPALPRTSTGSFSTTHMSAVPKPETYSWASCMAIR